MREQLGLQLEPAPTVPRAAALRSFHAKHLHVSVPEALAGERRAAKQNEAILRWFQLRRLSRDRPRWTPSEVHAVFSSWPITSVRRALTTLTTRGLLIHYRADRRPGPRGARESTWGLA